VPVCPSAALPPKSHQPQKPKPAHGETLQVKEKVTCHCAGPYARTGVAANSANARRIRGTHAANLIVDLDCMSIFFSVFPGQRKWVLKEWFHLFNLWIHSAI